jgi:hypothetical protein
MPSSISHFSFLGIFVKEGKKIFGKISRVDGDYTL